MPDLRSHWLYKLRQLNPNRSRVKGAAPHKPCLLSLLDMAQDGELQEPELRRTLGLNVRFNAFSLLALPRWGGKVDLAYAWLFLENFSGVLPKRSRLNLGQAFHWENSSK